MSKDPRAEVVKKALTDPAFKAALVKDPRTAVEKATGLRLPAGVQIKVVEDSSSVVHLVLPAAPSKQLDDKDLGKVSGGALVPQPTWCNDNTQYWPAGCSPMK